ncbi:MAG: deoxyribodipyrimidine photo-lyase [Cryomorphaceae bacterium]|nr:MAG: deoxyribodipyrimidine photo-lyase [Cryomorphaceae bacterium]
MSINAQSVAVFWFRRDLRLNDNHGLYRALSSGRPVLPVFVFDRDILDELPPDDRRVVFIYRRLENLRTLLRKEGGDLQVFYGRPLDVFKQISESFPVDAVYTNHDYEPYATRRDSEVAAMLREKDIGFQSFKDQVLFEGGDILKADGKPYTVYTPYSRKWLERMKTDGVPNYPSEDLLSALHRYAALPMPTLAEMGFEDRNYPFPGSDVPAKIVQAYGEKRDFPAVDGTSRLGIHLRFGTVSVRDMIRKGAEHGEVWLKQLVWREFFMSILHHFPHVVTRSFRPEYDRINWENNEAHFEAWCKGQTGYPIVDAGMRELLQTGHMHNRVRMITASFLTKHLLIDWRKGEAWFARHLLDFELASNNGSWQWAAGTGCDAAPYFRVFNPALQAEKFDAKGVYTRKWVPELNELNQYPLPVVEHRFARERAIQRYAEAVKFK